MFYDSVTAFGRAFTTQPRKLITLQHIRMEPLWAPGTSSPTRTYTGTATSRATTTTWFRPRSARRPDIISRTLRHMLPGDNISYIKFKKESAD
jgi:hypothetical protein